MPTVTYPSDVVPGPPRIALEIPEGWEQVWTPETLVAVREAGVTDLDALRRYVAEEGPLSAPETGRISVVG